MNFSKVYTRDLSLHESHHCQEKQIVYKKGLAYPPCPFCGLWRLTAVSTITQIFVRCTPPRGPTIERAQTICKTKYVERFPNTIISMVQGFPKVRTGKKPLHTHTHTGQLSLSFSISLSLSFSLSLTPTHTHIIVCAGSIV